MTTKRSPITSADEIVTVRGQHLYVGGAGGSLSERRFFLKGIAFPTPPPPPPSASGARAQELLKRSSQHSDGELSTHPPPYANLTGWNAVVDQLAAETSINVVRIYEMDCRYDYTPFLAHAASLGIYVIVPLTSRSGDGVLSRDALPPKCYPQKLYDYGKTCLKRYWNVPNVLAGVIGNEVMNDLDAWASAPCVRAYLDDLTEFSRSTTTSSIRNGMLPLMYATQHDSPTVGLPTDDAMKLTLDYLTCIESTKEKDGDTFNNDNFIYGINIESWCSSLQTFDYEEDGVSESSYHSLWNTLSGGNKTEILMDAVTGKVTIKQVPPEISPGRVAVPVVFSELGCSKDQFNRDNDAELKLVRDWKQIPLVVEGGPMADIISGFVAYGYDGGGNWYFRMMGGTERWDGNVPLEEEEGAEDYENFRKELAMVDGRDGEEPSSAGGGRYQRSSPPIAAVVSRPSCEKTLATIHKVLEINLYPSSRMPSYFTREEREERRRSRSFLKPFMEVSFSPEFFDWDQLNEDGAASFSGMSALVLVGSVAMLMVLPILAYGYVRRRQKRSSYTTVDEKDLSGGSMRDDTVNERSGLLHSF
eukprot:CAMPEP_0183718816 /NCGR_PEP_ID=MMETSP0737-20130205/11972_1 /TAXON_ID=385413 /ORGANISM="Thalassiosira miniscula, Strain CCMP1093" /LENGTH=587 /DNA_ID=CAMNT_0025948437 /DNA_START=189 /DNA_END=1952 /DNA_ORIENTATION=+